MSTQALTNRLPAVSTASITAFVVNAAVAIVGILGVLILGADMFSSDATFLGLVVVILVIQPATTVLAYQSMRE